MMIRIYLSYILAIAIYTTVVDGATETDCPKTIFLRSYNGTTLNEYTDYFWNNFTVLYTHLNKNKRTMLYIHGYEESVESESVQTVVQAYLIRNDHNTLALDYSKIANKFYPILAIDIFSVGDCVAAALDKLVKLGLDSEKLHIVGHSMGGQLAGIIGRKVNFRIPRITGLDPAGPLYNIVLPRLSYTDADFVDIIHTDAGFYGNIRKSGTADFFPNCGHRIQPGCPKFFKPYSSEDFCSHHRSWIFYAESVNSTSAFLSVRCDSSEEFSSSQCNNNPIISMGYGTPTNANGSYYLKTDKESPYGLGEVGAKN